MIESLNNQDEVLNRKLSNKEKEVFNDSLSSNIIADRVMLIFVITTLIFGIYITRTICKSLTNPVFNDKSEIGRVNKVEKAVNSDRTQVEKIPSHHKGF